MSKRIRVEKADARQEFARFMKGAKKYEIIKSFGEYAYTPTCFKNIDVSANTLKPFSRAK